MSALPLLARRRRQEGQTIVIALIVLLLLLILGFVFAGILNRSIQGTARQTTRFQANDLGEAGVRYALDQLVDSEAGADWRGAPVDLGAGNVTSDPDAFYLRRPEPGLSGNARFTFPGKNYKDQGGPDGLGFYTRVPFQNGRALVRVRYAPVDASLFYGDGAKPPTTGAGRSYLMIESVGRSGLVDLRDPTTLLTEPVNYRGFASAAAFSTGLTALSDLDRRNVNVRNLVAYAQIGITDDARFITNIHRETRPVELGVPNDLGASYAGRPVTSLLDPSNRRLLTSEIGRQGVPFNVGGIGNTLAGFGSIHVNGDLLVHGTLQTYLNPSLGDGITVAGAVRGADDNSALLVTTQQVNRTGATTAPTLSAPVTTTLTGNALDSRNGAFNTLGGVVRDGQDGVDASGSARGIGYREPPRIATDTQRDRYRRSTRDSGATALAGQYGHGRGVFVDNMDDRQTPRGEEGRAAAGDQESLVYDWLNPNNASFSRTGWRGPVYLPRGAELRLVNDGWTITRDAASAARTWRRPNGADSGSATARFRLLRGTDGQIHVVNSFSPGVTDIGANQADATIVAAPVFNGVLYFEGNVRVRGVIPTDAQVSVVSGATIYIEGSITKGILGNQVTASAASGATPVGRRIGRPSASMIGLFARDYVTVNPTLFVGPASGQTVRVKADVPGGLTYSPLKMENGETLTLQTELPLDPEGRRVAGTTSDPQNPSTWEPFATGYGVGAGARQNVRLILTHTAEEGVAPAIPSLSVNPGLFDGGNPLLSAYVFAVDTIATPQEIITYPMGDAAYQRFSRFESRGFPIVVPAYGLNAGDLAKGVISHNAPPATTPPSAPLPFKLGTTGSEYDVDGDLIASSNTLQFRTQGGGGYLLARAAVVPADIRIEAAIYAQEGSFFVIPGGWFNPNPNDTRERYLARETQFEAQGLTAAAANDAADLDRIDNFGAYPEVPFYGEPLDVRISVEGAVAENMPPPVAQQAEWLRKWGWIPDTLGATGTSIPDSHRRGLAVQNGAVVPNLTFSYDPVLGTGRNQGLRLIGDPNDLDNYGVRSDDYGRPLPALPRLPVSPALAYFGDRR